MQTNVVDALQNLQPTDPHYLQKLNSLLRAPSAVIGTDLFNAIHRGDKIYQAIENSDFGNGNSPLKDLQIVFDVLDKQVNDLNSQLKDALGHEGVQIQMAATLNGKKGKAVELPLPNFDKAPVPACLRSLCVSVNCDGCSEITN